jgi:predicted TIM-barrel fold metal-dependent hydrolase
MIMQTRRRFLTTTLGAGAALAAGAQPALTQPAKKREIVDAQVHMWKANSPDWPWDPGVKPQLPEPFTYERALALMDEAGVDRVVIVPPGLNYRNDYAIEAHQKHPNRFAVMGRIPLDDPNAKALVPKWKQQPGMLGARLSFNSPDTIAWLKNGTADWFWPAAEKAGVPVMFLAFGLVNLFEPIAAKHPGLTLIIDHMGVNTAIAKSGKTEGAIGHAVALAKYPNVSVKLSNLPNSSLEPYPFKDLNPHIKRLFDAYGPQRCHWGTDVTNGLGRVGWRQRLTHFTEAIDFMSEQDKDWVLGRSIRERLKWT